MCPNVSAAERNLSVAIMRILWGLNIKRKKFAKLPLDMRYYPHEVSGISAPDMPDNLVVRP